MKFSYVIETTASRRAVWELWTDVENWSKWDTELKSATLKGNFRLGANGELIPKNGTKAQFSITEFSPLESYAFTTKLPLADLTVRRFFSGDGDKTVFTHEIEFSGLLKGFWGAVLGKGFQKVLPDVMNKLRVLAEQKTNEHGK